MKEIKIDHIRRGRLNCRIGLGALDGSITHPPGEGKTNYAIYCLLGAISELLEAVKEALDDRAEK